MTDRASTGKREDAWTHQDKEQFIHQADMTAAGMLVLVRCGTREKEREGAMVEGRLRLVNDCGRGMRAVVALC